MPQILVIQFISLRDFVTPPLSRSFLCSGRFLLVVFLPKVPVEVKYSDLAIEIRSLTQEWSIPNIKFIDVEESFGISRCSVRPAVILVVIGSSPDMMICRGQSPSPQ